MKDILSQFSWIYSGEHDEEIEDEFKDTGWNDVSVSKDGEFKRRDYPIKIKIWHGTTPVVCCRCGVKRHEINANLLVAKAWHPDYYEGCFIIPKDGDKSNIRLDNLSIVDSDEFFQYRAERMIESKKKTVDWSIYGEFKKTSIEGLECTIDGVFRKNHRLLKAERRVDVLGRKHRVVIRCKVNGRMEVLNAAKIVAQTWSPQSWFDGCMIWYKDKDKHNIHSDNLILVSEEKYYKIQSERISSNPLTFEDSYEKIKRRANESSIALKYFETGDFTQINKYIDKHLLPYILKYALSKGFSLMSARNLVSEVISILYEWIIAYRPISSYTFFCEKLIRVYKKTNGFGFYERIPNPLTNKFVSQLNLECLCEMYKCTKIK